MKQTIFFLLVFGLLLIILTACNWVAFVNEAERAGEAAIEQVIEDETGVNLPRPSPLK